MDDRRGEILVVAILLFVLTYITFGLRVYVRTCIIKAFGKDDWAMLVTLIFWTMYLACQLGGVAYGTGQHRTALTDANAQIALRYWFFCEVFYALATSALKFAIGYFLLRITIVRTHIWIIRGIMAITVVVCVVYTFIVIFQCRPTSYWWDLNPDAKGTCLSANVYVITVYVVSALNATADWVFGILPFFIVKDLRMRKSLKAIVAIILGLGAIGSAATIIRMPYIWTVKSYKGDFLWRTTDAAIWSTVEIGVGITAGCIATLKPLMKRFLHSVGIRSNTSAPNSKMPWPNTKLSTFKEGYARHGDDSSFRPPHDISLTTTTVTSRRASKSVKGLSSWTDRHRSNAGIEDMMPSEGRSASVDLSGLQGWKAGISKSVEVTTTEERDAARSTEFASDAADDGRHQSQKSPTPYERV